MDRASRIRKCFYKTYGYYPKESTMLEIAEFVVECTENTKIIEIFSTDPRCRFRISVEVNSHGTDRITTLYAMRIEKDGKVINSVRDTNLKIFLYKCGVRIAFSLNQHASELVWDFLLEQFK